MADDAPKPSRVVWKLQNPKDKSRDDVAMYDGREMKHEDNNLDQGHYELTSQCVGKGLTSLRQILLEVTVWERGEVVLKETGSVSPKTPLHVTRFKIATKGKINIRYTGAAAYGFVNVHLKARLEKRDFSQASTVSFASFNSPSMKAPTSSAISSMVSSIGAGGVSASLIPRYCWSRTFSDDYDAHKEFSVSVYEGMRLAGLGLRMKRYIDAETEKGKLPVMNPFKKSPAGPRMGVPLGGIGAGTIGRGWRGDFGRWTIIPGFPNYKTIDADNFSAFVSRKSKPGEACVLSTSKCSNKKLKVWNWGLSGKKCKNYSLYPQSITQYEEPFDKVVLTCRQVSPFLPNNYKETSYPIGVFEWFIENNDDVEIEAAIMFTFQNGIGESFDTQGGHRNVGFTEVIEGSKTEIRGVELKYNLPKHTAVLDDVIEKKKQNEENLDKRFTIAPGALGDSMRASGASDGTPRSPRDTGIMGGMAGAQMGSFLNDSKHNVKDPLSFGMAVTSDDPNVVLSTHNKFLIEGKTNIDSVKPKTVWDDFSKDGVLSNMESLSPSEPGQIIGAATAGKVTVPPGEYRRIIFSLAWDVPICRFNSGTGYFRRYTNFFGRDGNNAPKMAIAGLKEYGKWVAEIEKWQNPILLDNNLPDWYKQTLFNELYYLVEGGSIWVGEKVSDDPEVRSHQMKITPPAANPETFETVGKFGYLESLEYIMVNTYDVHFYGSWALIMLFPLLDMSLQVDFCDATIVTHNIQWRTLHSGEKATRKVWGAVPHDLGNPGDDPWTWVNSYCIQEINSWKDLNSKLALQIYRDYHLTKNLDFLKRCWKVVQIAIEYVERFDKDGDGLLENEGFPDQTYDTWSATGPSAYCGGLWVAALSACQKMAEALGESDKAKKFQEKWERAKKAYHEKLWSGEYYLYDTSDSDHFDSIQADSMCGQWWARGCGLPSISSDECVKSSFKKIFDFNVKQFQCGQIGPINGMKPDGKIDTSCMQSVEVWTGTAYGLAAGMMQEGLIEEAFSTAKGISRVTYTTKGYMFQTPEAWDASMNYRALAYMRPLAVWAIQYAWENGAKQLRPQPNQDLLETELADEISTLKSSLIGKTFRAKNTKNLPTIKVAFVGEDDESQSKDLFLACWHRVPVNDSMRQAYATENETSGEEELQAGMPIRYDFVHLSSTKEAEEKQFDECASAMVIVCCYSVISEKSRHWMETRFLPEVNHRFPNTPVLVVATGIAARTPPPGAPPLPEGAKIMTPEETKTYSIQLQKLCPNIRSHVECSPITFKGFRTLANAGLAICLIGKVKEDVNQSRAALPAAGAGAAEKMKAKDEQCVVM